MPQRKQYNRNEKVGQSTIFGSIEGLDKLVTPPEVVEENGQRVVHVVVPLAEQDVPGYIDQALKVARAMQPEVKSNDKPPWLDAGWQARKRMSRAGN